MQALFYSFFPMISPIIIRIIIIMITLVTALVIHFIKRKTIKLLKINEASTAPLPPGPPGWPILGCLPAMWRRERSRPVHEWMGRTMEELGTDIAYFRVGGEKRVVVSSPEISREFLKRNDAMCSSRPETMATRMLSHSFLTTAVGPGGEQWKKMKRVVSQAFKHTTVKWLLDKRTQEADNLVRFLYNQCSKTSQGEVVNVRTAVKQYSGAVMKRMIFNKRYFGEERDDGGSGFEEEEYVSAAYTVLFHLYNICVSDYFPWLKWLDLDGQAKKVRIAIETIKKYQDPIIEDRIRQWRELKTKTEPEDVLDIFVSLQDSSGNPILSVQEVKAQVMELLVGSVDTMHRVAEWGLSEMLNRPETISKCMEELDKVVGKERLLQESDIPNLPYLVACARESLRLHPVAPFNLPHMAKADCTVAGYHIPEGANVLLSRLGLGRNPKVWSDPLRFDPGRHLVDGPKANLAEPELKFISFSTGRRGCTAADLGSNMIVMGFGRLLQGFTWKIPDGSDKIDMKEDASLFKATPLYAHAKPRLSPSVYSSLVC